MHTLNYTKLKFCIIVGNIKSAPAPVGAFLSGLPPRCARVQTCRRAARRFCCARRLFSCFRLLDIETFSFARYFVSLCYHNFFCDSSLAMTISATFSQIICKSPLNKGLSAYSDVVKSDKAYSSVVRSSEC